MKRSHVLGVALLAIVAVSVIGVAGALAHKSKKQVATTMTIVFTPGEPAGGSGQVKDGTLSGAVGSTKPPCIKGRTVTVAQVGGPTIGDDKVAPDGGWEVSIRGTQPTGGEQYTASVPEQKIVKRSDQNHKHVIKCLAATQAITIPTP